MAIIWSDTPAMGGRSISITVAFISACAGATPTPRPVSARLQQCRVPDVSEPLWCGDLRVPENRNTPHGRTITLHFVVIPATGAKTLPPLYDLAGGPGIAGTSAAELWTTVAAIHRRHRDIVLVDQRGTGGSHPLPCDVAMGNPLAPVLDVSEVRACRDQLATGADLSQYSTSAAVEDIDAVRAALGQERIDLIGLSYGTRLAQEYVRAHGARVRAMVLLGTVSPEEKLPLSFGRNAHALLARLAEQCAHDAACRTAVPDLASDLEALQHRFIDGRVTATLANGTTASIDAGPFWEGVRAQLTSTTSQRRLPWLLHEAARGQFAPLLAAMVGGPERAFKGLLLAVSCPEDTLHITDAEIEAARDPLFGNYRVHQQIAACRTWGVAAHPLRAGFVASAVPTLLIAGDMDHVTPVRQAQDVAAHLSNARLVVIPNLGHLPDGLTNMECYDQIINQFYEAGSVARLDLACVKTMQPPPFRTSDK